MTNKSSFNDSGTLCKYSGNLSDLQIVAICCYLFLGCLSLFGNIVFITAMAKCNLVKSGGYLTVVHYAITDIISGLLDATYMPVSIMFQDTFVPAYVPALFMVFAEMSRKSFLLFMALTRFYSIMFPIGARLTMTLSWYKKMLALTWLISIFICTPLWIGKCFYFDPCSYRFRFNTRTKSWHSIYTFAYNLLVTLLIITTYPTCFCMLRRKNYLWKIGSYSGMQSIPGSSTRSFHSKAKEKCIFYLFFMNSVIFILYWLPIYLFEMWQISFPNYGLIKEIIRGIQISYNPYAYYWVNKSIRRATNKLLRCEEELILERKTSQSNDDRF